MEDKIEELEERIIELNYLLVRAKDKELIYLDILSNIDDSINTLFKREAENERFSLGEEFNFRESMVNLKKSLDEYKRIYKIKL